MATSKNVLSTELGWIHELAKNEINPDANSTINDMAGLDPKQLIEESTIGFLEDLRDLFTMFAKSFNGYSENNSRFSEAKIYGITNTPADFMVFRNNVKLVFSNSAHGIINATFTQHTRNDLAADGSSTSQKQSHDIIAQMGPFMDVSWTYQGEKVNPERLVKYFFIEFVKASRQLKKSSANQLLLKQIKALLHDQGIDL
ncbi:MAG TPA: hypothetical protein PLH57_00175 [Oligoflexia bacterium]|nr:hypothetical protein [Oligoflexia bacterium]